MLRRTSSRVLGGLVAGLLTLVAVADASAQQLAGVLVDAEGVVSKRIYADPGGRLTRQRNAAQIAALGEMAAQSPIRHISLNRLEAAIEAQLAKGQRLTEAMRYLAGLKRVQFVFFYPETGDIVIAGPAEGWVEDLSGRIRGVHTGAPIIELRDLLVALRLHAPGSRETRLVGCSIDPTPEGLAAMQEFLRRVGGRATPRDTQAIVNGLQSSLGMQTVSVLGVPANTHFAQVMIEADYRMKLIGINLERPPVKMTSYVDRARPASVSRNALQRWFFVPDYECVRVSEDSLAMELVGNGVKLVGEDEVVADDGGRRRAAGQADRASQGFVEEFTKKYPELAERSPVYAQLRNCIDLLIATLFIRQQDYYAQADWSAETLRDESKLAVEDQNTPKQVATAVNAIWRGNRLMTPIGGGVEIMAARALKTDNLLEDTGGNLKEQHQGVRIKDLPAGTWWWD